MGLDVASIESSSFHAAPGPGREPRVRDADRVDAAELSPSEIPASPPPEVIEAMEGAARVARELEAQGRELRFAAGEDGLRIELRERDGSVLRTLRPSELLDVATGAPLD